MRIGKLILKVVVTITIMLLLIAVYARFIEPKMLVSTKLTEETKKDIAEVRVVFFTDVHIGEYKDQVEIEKIVKKINAEKPNIVIFGGDFFSDYYSDVEKIDLDYVASEMKKIEAKHKFAIYGNHDYKQNFNDEYSKFMRNSGFELLRNENVKLEQLGVQIVAYDDNIRGVIEKVNYSKNDGYYNVLAIHEPDIVELVDIEGIDLALAGHTHGGQVYVPFLTKRIVDSIATRGLMGDYVKGYYGIGQGGKMYLSRGIGMSNIPMRFLNIPQLVVVDIVPE